MTTHKAWISNNTFEISSYTSDTLSGQKGLEVGKILDEYILNSDVNSMLYVSLKGVDTITPSFINGSFLYLIDLYGENYFRHHIKVINGKPQIIKHLGQQLREYISQRSNFLSTLAPNQIYCAIDNSSEGFNLRNQFQKLVRSQVSFCYNPDDSTFSEKAKKLIQESSAFVGFLTSEDSDKQAILEEANYALQFNKPSLLIIKHGLQVHVPSSLNKQIQKVYFNENNKLQTLRNLNKVILKNQSQENRNDTSRSITFGEAVAWGALGVGLTLLIASLFAEE